MSKLTVHDENTAPEGAGQVLSAIKQEMGQVANIFGIAANSPAVLKAFTTYSQILDEEGTLSGPEREAIALASAQVNNCRYCQSAHTQIAQEAGLSEDQILDIRKFDIDDEQLDALAEFTRKVVETRAEIGDEELQELREAGYDDGQIVEIHAQIIRNIWTNYFNHIFETEIDMPEAPEVKNDTVGAQA